MCVGAELFPRMLGAGDGDGDGDEIFMLVSHLLRGYGRLELAVVMSYIAWRRARQRGAYRCWFTKNLFLPLAVALSSVVEPWLVRDRLIGQCE